MLSFFKTKPFLKDLLPPEHLDFHSHILPGIDDGAATIDDTIALVLKLQHYGCTQLIATPHVMNNVWENSASSITSNLGETRQILESKGITIPIKAAAEYLMDDNFITLYEQRQLLTLRDNYVLVEMSYINPPIQLYQILFDLQVAGYIPVLAHPERYSFYHSNFDEYRKLKNAGCMFQLNLLSIVGYYGADVGNVAKKLLSLGMIDFAGSDIHHKQHAAAFEKRIITKDHGALKDALTNNKFFRF